MHEMRRFVTLTGAWLIGFITLAAGINYLIDPYGIFSSPRIEFINRDKTQAIGQPHLAKAYLVETADPATLLIGDSRVDVGLNPTSSNWRSDFTPVFNLAIPGNSLPEHLRYLQHALATHQPTTVIIGLSFDDCFVWPASAYKPAQDPAADQNTRLYGEGAVGLSLWLARIKDFTYALISLDALEDSIMTIFNQNNPYRPYMTALGWHSAGDFRGSVDTEGYYNVVMAKDRSRVNTLLKWGKAPRFDLDPLKKIISLSSAHNAKVIIFTPPSYIDEFEIMKQSKVLAIYDSWKQDLVDVVYRAKNAGKDVSLWDFNRINVYSMETLPGPADRTHQMRWFWETNHFKAELGDRIIASLMEDSGTDLGIQLTPDNIELQISLMHDRLLEFEQSHERDVRRIESLVSVHLSSLCLQDSVPCGAFLNGPLPSARVTSGIARYTFGSR
jgi:hypothetical protein